MIIIVTYLPTCFYVSLCIVCNTTLRLRFAEENVFIFFLSVSLSIPFSSYILITSVFTVHVSYPRDYH